MVEGSAWNNEIPAGAAGAVEFPAGVSSVTEARQYIRTALPLSDQGQATAELLVSELAANAVHHANSPFRIWAARERSTVRVEISDTSPTMPRRRDTSMLDSTGRGLNIVDACAAAWGVNPAPDGKTVWFELHDPLD